MALWYERKIGLLDSVVIIDYNMGNLRSVEKAFKRVGAKVKISNNHNVIKEASKIVLPGVGSFKDGMRNLRDLKLVELLNREILINKKPFLGICLGMQLISKIGYENGQSRGLGWIDAEVIRFDFHTNQKRLKVPHIGWNNVIYKNSNSLFFKIEDGSDFYFVHSYYCNANNSNLITTTTDYGIEFVSSLNRENIFAVQFHPEKSQKVGLQLLTNFINIEV